MANTPKDSADLLTVISSIVVALIGAAPPLTQALKTYIDDLKTKGYLDNLPFTILKIERHTAAPKNWLGLRRFIIFYIILSILFITFFSVNFYKFSRWISIITLIFWLCFFITYIQALRRMGSQSEKVKLVYFKSASIVVVAKKVEENIKFRESVIIQCINALKILKVQAIELDSELGFISATTYKNLLYPFGGKFTIQIENLENAFNLNRLRLTVRYDDFSFENSPTIIGSMRLNSFIRQFGSI